MILAWEWTRLAFCDYQLREDSSRENRRGISGKQHGFERPNIRSLHIGLYVADDGFIFLLKRESNRGPHFFRVVSNADAVVFRGGPEVVGGGFGLRRENMQARVKPFGLYRFAGNADFEIEQHGRRCIPAICHGLNSSGLPQDISLEYGLAPIPEQDRGPAFTVERLRRVQKVAREVRCLPATSVRFQIENRASSRIGDRRLARLPCIGRTSRQNGMGLWMSRPASWLADDPKR